ncbi:MAG: divergent polysaccharide deacetylase family protein [Proteobacteria bacterium]|nr:divergent polysaccharide deacetylase family protein [Pseudomonadota bacterium]
MEFKFEHKSLIMGVATGFLVAMLVFCIIWQNIKNNELLQTNRTLNEQIELKKIGEIPLTVIKDTSPTSSEEIVYEEFPKHDEDELTRENDINESMPLYEKNKQPITLDPKKVKIAIIIDDLGVHKENSFYSANNLPKEVTFSYLPYGKSTQNIIKQEFKKHREAMLHLPTEPISSIDPGPNALLDKMSAEKIEQLTYHNLNHVLDYIVGVNNHMGSKFTANQQHMEQALKVINKNKLFFLDSFTTAKTKALSARNVATPEMPILKRHIFLDHKRTKDFISAQLARTEKIAKRKGFAIAIGHPHKITTDSILEWSKTLSQKGIQLVPITSILDIKK